MRLRRRRENEAAISDRHDIEAARHDADAAGRSAFARSCCKAANAVSGGGSRLLQLARASTVRGSWWDLAVLDAAPEHAQDRQDIADEQKDEERRDEESGAKPCPQRPGRRPAPERPARPRLAAWFVIAWARKQEAARASSRVPEAYSPSHAGKRACRSSRCSAQNLASLRTPCLNPSAGLLGSSAAKSAGKIAMAARAVGP